MQQKRIGFKLIYLLVISPIVGPFNKNDCGIIVAKAWRKGTLSLFNSLCYLRLLIYREATYRIKWKIVRSLNMYEMYSGNKVKPPSAK